MECLENLAPDLGMLPSYIQSGHMFWNGIELKKLENVEMVVHYEMTYTSD